MGTENDLCSLYSSIDWHKAPRVGYLLEQMPERDIIRATMFVQFDNGTVVAPHGFLCCFDTDSNVIDDFIQSMSKVTGLPNSGMTPREFNGGYFDAFPGAVELMGTKWTDHFVREMSEEEISVFMQEICMSSAYVASPMFSHAIKHMHGLANEYGAGDIFMESLDRMSGMLDGGFRWLIVVLGMLMTRGVEYMDYTDRGRGFVRNQPTSFLSYRQIQLALPKDKLIKAAKRVGRNFFDAMPKRRHHVMGHWCYSNKYPLDKRCLHEMEKVIGRPQQVCKHCGGKKWWRDSHARGDASLGWVHKEYVFEKNKKVNALNCIRG